MLWGIDVFFKRNGLKMWRTQPQETEEPRDVPKAQDEEMFRQLYGEDEDDEEEF